MCEVAPNLNWADETIISDKRLVISYQHSFDSSHTVWTLFVWNSSRIQLHFIKERFVFLFTILCPRDVDQSVQSSSSRLSLFAHIVARGDEDVEDDEVGDDWHRFHHSFVVAGGKESLALESFLVGTRHLLLAEQRWCNTTAGARVRQRQVNKNIHCLFWI